MKCIVYCGHCFFYGKLSAFSLLTAGIFSFSAPNTSADLHISTCCLLPWKVHDRSHPEIQGNHTNGMNLNDEIMIITIALINRVLGILILLQISTLGRHVKGSLSAQPLLSPAVQKSPSEDL